MIRIKQPCGGAATGPTSRPDQVRKRGRYQLGGLILFLCGLFAQPLDLLQAQPLTKPVLDETRIEQPVTKSDLPATETKPLAKAGQGSETNSVKEAFSNGMESLDHTYQLAIGDRLSFRIIEDEEEPRPLFVTDSGDLELPYLGRFPAEGKTCRELAGEIKRELEKEYYYNATVILAVDVKTKSRGKIYLVGPVRVPGPQEVPNHEVLTLSKAILRAGGFTETANARKVKVTRPASGPEGTEETFVVDVESIYQDGRMENDLVLKPGDLVYVTERYFVF